MRSVLALGILLAWCASADAAPVHRSKPPGIIHLRGHQRVGVRPSQAVTAPERFAVPGWTDEETRRWMDNASAGWDS
jgi:hypothetical protein